MKITIYICFIICILFAFMNNGFGQQLAGSSDFNSVGYLNIKLISNNVTANNTTLDIVVNKSIEPIGSKLRFRYDIDTPKIDDFYFVLALDSSSSLKTYGNAEQATAIIQAVPEFISKTVEKPEYKYKNFSISVISWDNNTDFAYSHLNNTDPTRARVVSMRQARGELGNGVFGDFNDATNYYNIQGSDGTNLSSALWGSIEILKNNPVVMHHRTSKFIILVVGEGEFDKCNESLLLEEAQKEGISIYAIIMNPSKYGDLLSHLQRVTNNKTQSCQGPEEQLPALLEAQLELALAKAISEAAASNVTLVEPICSYLEIENQAQIEVNEKEKNTPVRYDVLGRRTNSSVSFPLVGGLMADCITTVTFYSNINFSLPGSFNESSPSSLNFTWLKEIDPFYISIPRNNIGFVTAPTNIEQATESDSSWGRILLFLQSINWNYYQFRTMI